MPEEPRWVAVYNSTAEEIPAFGLMRMTGIDSEGIVTVAKPNTNSQVNILINSPVPIPASSYGVGHNQSPAAVLYDTADGTPALDEVWGAESGSWKAGKGKTGAKIVGGHADGLVTIYHGFGRIGGAAAFSGARVYHSTDQSYSFVNPVEFDTEVFDEGDYFDIADPTRLTIPEDGYYLVGCCVTFEETTTSTYYGVDIIKNGGGALVYERRHVPAPTNPLGQTIVLTTLLFLEADDYLEVSVLCKTDTTDVTTDLLAAADRVPVFWIHKVG
jgi:hypothetical protein